MNKEVGIIWDKERWDQWYKENYTAPYTPTRIDVIGQNGNDGLHYDNVSHPRHYCEHPSGIECIQITEHMGFNLGCALKYIWRCDLKKDAIEDLRKAIWYIEREIAKRTKGE